MSSEPAQLEPSSLLTDSPEPTFDPSDLTDRRHPHFKLYKDYQKLIESNRGFADQLRKDMGAELTPESMRAARDELFIDWIFDTIWPEEDDRLKHQEMRLLFETKWQNLIKANQERARTDAQAAHDELQRQIAAARLGVQNATKGIVGPDGRPLTSET